MCFFSATLHSQSIHELAELICCNPTWIDLKGQETTMPDTLHHVVLPVLPSQHYQLTVGPHSKNYGIVLDEIHTPQELQSNKASVNQALASQQIKEMKCCLVQQLIDQFQVSFLSQIFSFFFFFLYCWLCLRIHHCY